VDGKIGKESLSKFRFFNSYSKDKKEGKTFDFRDIIMGSITPSKKTSLKTMNKKDFERMRGIELNN